MRKIMFFSLIMISLSMLSLESKAQWSSGVRFGGSYFEGNVNKMDILGKGDISYKDSIYEFSAFAKISYGEGDVTKTDAAGNEVIHHHIQNNEEYSGGVKFDYMPYSMISPFVMYEIYKNRYKGYDLRNSGLFGVKYTFYQSDKSNFSISAAGVYDNEQYVGSKPTSNNWRISIRPKFKQKIGDNITFEHLTFFKYRLHQSPSAPDLNNTQNKWIIDSETKLGFQLTKKMALELSYEIDYDGNPPSEDIKNTDTRTAVSLVIKL